MPENDHSFFQNTACKYFPCHKTDRPEEFNCLFCYCPLYALGDRCGGNFRYTAKGIKDCSGCLVPHSPGGYQRILSRFSDISALASRPAEPSGGTPGTPRVLLAGVHSGCGKTTVTCAVLQALVHRGLKVGAFKCGPDYIDPMFHSRIIGAKSANLDSFFLDENTLCYLLAKNSRDRDVSVLEGVMGYYDGRGLDSTQGSTYEIARITATPTVLVVDARGASLSVLAAIQGFAGFRSDSGIRGVILNQCGERTYGPLREAILRQFGGRIRPLGYLPRLPEAALESRHLGLVTAQEIGNLREKLALLAAQAEKTIDLEGLLALARTAPALEYTPVVFPRLPQARIAVARDAAFCFYYEDNLAALRELGAELVPFSPLTDPALPENIQGLYLGGGYPELYAEALSKNGSLRSSIRAALERGLPCVAECGGLLYLAESLRGHPMVGFPPGNGENKGKLTRFGYVTLTPKADSLLFRAGEPVPAHEFHYYDLPDPGGDLTARKADGRQWDCGFATPRLYAGFPHLHFYARPALAERFYRACLEEKNHV